ncbi:phosphopantetheine-binding protein [Streptomyces sp. ISL-11]|uniref:phosphopantetheine-binding protein n=1 Tax=Streptomyces sp. ISL-11 TaxID=2819174 RepID=UPI001BE6C90A|nr:phosphopantetheine-binding protein [Streptomyces sp. ISL-11]MBT2383361.1 hypothetical protein [Streptomyces sp. ISL-11]
MSPVTHPAELLDCLQTNLALLADRLHGPGTSLRLGAPLRLRTRTGDHGLPTVEPTLDQHTADACTLLGLAVAEHRTAGPAAFGTGRPVYVVADAFHLPWVPYFGQKHIEHSFVAEATDGGVTISDAYHNETPWGPARPLTRAYRADELAAILEGVPGGFEIIEFAPAPLGPAPDPAVGFGPRDAEDYVRAYAGHPDRAAALDRFTLETWLLARSRRLHAAFLEARDGGVSTAVHQHLATWNALVEHAYLAFRRVSRGHAEPPGLLMRAAALLRADVTLFARPAGEGDVRDAVRATVAAVLDVPAPRLETEPLTAIPSFGSFRMVEIVERLEKDFAVEFDAGDLVPEKLHSLDSLCALVTGALAGTGEGDRRGA